jgi:hypothetical protein
MGRWAWFRAISAFRPAIIVEAITFFSISHGCRVMADAGTTAGLLISFSMAGILPYCLLMKVTMARKDI